MRKFWNVIAVAVVCLGLGLAVVGCGSSTPAAKDKMGSEKMDGGKMGDKMGGDKMNSEKKDKM
jgi:hypothetical protein